MSASATEPTTAVTPRPLSPTDAQPIDGSAAPFAWAALPGARAYRLQIATDTAFTDVLYTVDAGTTTLLTLYEMLPENGATFYWRVQAQTGAGWQPWSTGAAFKAATDLQAKAHGSTQRAAVSAPSDRPATPPAEGTPVDEGVAPHQTETTSRNAMLFYMAVMFLSFLITTLLIIRAAP